MKVLRLSTSSESEGSTPPELRARAVAERAIAEASGEPVETVVKFIWPDPRLPGLVERWLNEHEPDAVLIKVASYTVCKTSVALRLAPRHRRVARAVERIGATRLVAFGLPRVPGWGLVQRGLRRTVGVSGFFEPADVARTIEETMRCVLQRERVALVVRAPTRPPYVTEDGGRAEAVKRWQELFDALAATCRTLHVTYLTEDAAWTDEQILATRAPDQAHWGDLGHRVYGEAEGHALLEAWREAFSPAR
jgi:hypothetical protein